jgi:long-chain acyl-CoA synthetase
MSGWGPMGINRVFAEHLDHLCVSGGLDPAVSQESESHNFLQLRDRVYSTAQSLWDAGLRPGDRIGLRVERELDHFLLTLSLLLLGTEHIAVPRHDSPEQATKLLSKIGSDRTISDSDVSKFLRTSPTAPRQLTTLVENGGVFLRTSGSVEESRLILFKPDQMIQQAQHSPVSDATSFLRLAHIEHNASRRHRLYAFLRGAHNVFLPAENSWVANAGVLLSHGVNTIEMARSHLQSLAYLGAPKSLWQGVHFYISGSPVPTEMRKQFLDSVSSSFFVRYGATEAGTLSIAAPEDHDVAGCVGIPIATFHESIKSGSREKPASIMLKSPGMATQYFQSNRNHVYFKDGWFMPGDLGYLDEMGRLVLVGREGRAFTVGSINVFPEEVENTLSRFPGVKEVVVLGIPSKLHDHVPVAVVSISPDSNFSSEAFLKWAKIEAGLVAPRAVRVVDSFPRTAEGKIDFRRAWDNAE